MSAPEVLEHMEHAAHAGHGSSTGKHIGITMAVLGVLLAFCSAMVGSARTDLIKTMVEQENAHSKYQAQATKYRLVVSELQALSASIPRDADIKALAAELDRIQASAARPAAPAPEKAAPTAPDKAALAAKDAKEVKEAADPADTATILSALRASTLQLARLSSPRKDDVLRFIELVNKYRHERDVATEWTESFDEAVHAYSESSEHYEWAQLCAEVGIVIASIALLFSSRKVWGASLVLGVLCVGIIGTTFAATRSEVAHAEERIEETGKKYLEIRKDQSEQEEDERLVRDVEGILGVTVAEQARPERAGEHGGERGGEHGGERGGEHGGHDEKR